MTSERRTTILTRRRRLRDGFTALACGAILAALPAAAPARAEARSDEGTAAPRAPVQGLITDAVAEYDAGHFEEARALFREAHHEWPSARTLRGIGMASYELRDYVEATRTLGASLKETRHALTPEQRRHVEGLLARAETFVGRFAVRLRPPEATLLVDGKPAAFEPDGMLLLPFGHHRLVATLRNRGIAERAVDVMGGEREELSFEGSAAASTLPVALAVSPPPLADTALKAAPPPVGAGASPPRSTRRLAPVFAAGAAVGAVASVAAGLWWRDRSNELDACRAAGDRCRNESTVAGQSHVAAAMTIGFGVAALTSAITALVLWPPRPGLASLSHAFGCLPEKEGISCVILF